MSQLWFCQIDDQEHGPLSPGQLKQLAASGKLRPDHMVREAQSKNWTRADRIKGLVFGKPAGAPSQLHENPTDANSGVHRNSPEYNKRVRVLFEIEGQPVAAFLGARYEDCLKINDQRLLKLFATAVRVHSWTRVKIGGVEFKTVLAMQTLPLKSPQIPTQPLVPLRADDFEYLDGPRSFHEKIHILGDSENDGTSRKFLQAGFYFSAKLARGSLIGYKNRVWIVPTGSEQSFLETLRSHGAIAFQSLQSFPDPIPDESPKSQGNVVQRNRSVDAKVKQERTPEQRTSFAIVPVAVVGILLVCVVALLGIGGLWIWQNRVRVDSASSLAQSNSSTDPNRPSRIEDRPIRVSSESRAVDALMAEIEISAAADMTEWQNLRDQFYQDKSSFTALLCIGSLPTISDEIDDIKADGGEVQAVERLREIVREVAPIAAMPAAIEPHSHFRLLSALQALKELGNSAQSALPDIQQLSQSTSDPLIQSFAEQATQAITAPSLGTSSPSTVADDNGLSNATDSNSTVPEAPTVALPASVVQLIELIDRSAMDDLTEWLELRDSFYRDPSLLNAILCLGTLPLTTDEVEAIKSEGHSMIAVDQLRQLMGKIIETSSLSERIADREYYRLLLALCSLREFGKDAQSALPDLEKISSTSDDPLLLSLSKQAIGSITSTTVEPISEHIPGSSDGADEILEQLRATVARLPAPSPREQPDRFLARIETLLPDVMDEWSKAFAPLLGQPLSSEEAFTFLHGYDYVFDDDRYMPSRGQELADRLRSLRSPTVTNWCKSSSQFSLQLQEPGFAELQIMAGLIISQDSFFDKRSAYDEARAERYRLRLATISPTSVREFATQLKPSVADEPELTTFELELAMAMTLSDCFFQNDRFDQASFERAIQVARENNVTH